MPKKTTKKLPPIHPGEMMQDILSEAGLSANALALALRIPREKPVHTRQRSCTQRGER